MSYASYARFLRNVNDEKLIEEHRNNRTRKEASKTEQAYHAWAYMQSITGNELARRAAK